MSYQDNQEHEHSFDLFGSRVRLLIGPPLRPELPAPELAALELEAFLRGFQRRISRFDATSELSAMNESSAERCEVSPLLALTVRAGLWAAERSGGLVDPTLVSELERAGYARSRAALEPAPLADALAAAPPRKPARPSPEARWRGIEVDQRAGLVWRPPGVRFDTGGCGKGIAADLCARRLAGYASYAVDAGGDIAIGGDRPAPRLVEIAGPRSSEPVHGFELTRGAVATSGISARLWRERDGFAHHLIDPSTGRPAWTGVVQATALADSALEAETLAKMALLSGPERGLELLQPLGGLLVLDGGEVMLAESSQPVVANEPVLIS
jgi:thiamine biosynthesis lipoprotein